MTKSFNYILADITDIHENDVLCGRGAGITKHTGNKRWRTLIQDNQQKYIALPRNQRPVISESIVLAVRSLSPPGRFLAKDPQTQTYYDIGDEKANEKTAQAMRDSKKNKHSQSTEETDIAMALPNVPSQFPHSLVAPPVRQEPQDPFLCEGMEVIMSDPIPPCKRASDGLLRMSIGSISMDWGMQSSHARRRSNSIARPSVKGDSSLDGVIVAVPCAANERVGSGFSMASFGMLPDDQFEMLEASCADAAPGRDSCVSRISVGYRWANIHATQNMDDDTTIDEAAGASS